MAFCGDAHGVTSLERRETRSLSRTCRSASATCPGCRRSPARRCWCARRTGGRRTGPRAPAASSSTRVMQRTVHAPAAPRGVDVHALYPQESRGAPVAPFVGDKQAANHLACGVGDDVEPLLGRVEHRSDARLEHVRVEALALGLPRHVLLKSAQPRDVGSRRIPHPYRDVVHVGPPCLSGGHQYSTALDAPPCAGVMMGTWHPESEKWISR